MTPLRADEHGVIVGFPHHDGSLDGVILQDDGAMVTFVIRSSSGAVGQLQLNGVRGLHLENFREGNIVFSIQLWSVPRARKLGHQVQEIQNRLHLDLSAVPDNHVVLRVTPSYGADVLAVCKSAEVAGLGQIQPAS